jgi:hypothetical protein
VVLQEVSTLNRNIAESNLCMEVVLNKNVILSN